ncbi:MAG TPA: hypothetical protein VIW69_05650 [Candidatus Elarobacter sp.]
MQAIIGLPPPDANQQRMYAITFDMDTETLQQSYPGDSWRNAYVEIRRILIEEGFDRQQGSVYFANPSRIDAVKCVLASQRLARELPRVRGVRGRHSHASYRRERRSRTSHRMSVQTKPGNPSRASAA